MATPGEVIPGFVLDDGPGPARTLAAVQAAALVGAALAGAGFGATPSAAPLRPRLGARFWVSAGVLTAAGIVAAIWYTRHTRERTAPPPVMQPVATPVPAAQPATHDAEPDFEIEPAPAPAPAPAPVPHAARPLPHATPAPAPAPAAAETAEELLARANALRGQRKWQDADALYDRVAEKFPGTLSAHVADVASGELALEHLGAPARARQRFEAALAAKPGGPLAEEARYGIAEAYRALGDAVHEAAALRAFLAAHPGSERRAQVEARLGSLSRPH